MGRCWSSDCGPATRCLVKGSTHDIGADIRKSVVRPSSVGVLAPPPALPLPPSPRTSPPLAPLISVQLTPYRTPPSPGWSGCGHADSVLRSHGPERSMRVGQCPLSPPPSPPNASPPLPLLHRQSATAAAPGRWQYATAAATGTAAITTTLAATRIAAAAAAAQAICHSGSTWSLAVRHGRSHRHRRCHHHRRRHRHRSHRRSSRSTWC